MKKSIIWGATGQAKMIRPILEHSGYAIVAVFDNNPSVSAPFRDVPLIGGWQEFLAYRPRLEGGAEFAVAIGGDLGRDRCELAEKLKAEGLKPATLVHATAHVAATSTLGEGCQILPMSAVCEEARIGRYCIVNTNASVDHESVLGHGVHVMPGATIAGAVRIGSFVTIGSNATVLPRVSIGEGAVIGAGAVVTKDVEAYAVVVGVPGRVKRKRSADETKRHPEDL